MNIHQVLAKTDWKLLAKQKAELISAADNLLLEGLLNFLDAIQDAAEEEGYPVVWLSGRNGNDDTMKYTRKQLNAIAAWHNWGGIYQDEDGHIVWNTNANSMTGWRRATEEQVTEALKSAP